MKSSINSEGFKGKRVRFRSVRIEDADFIQSLRTSDKYGHYLSGPASSVRAQKEWIEKYKLRELEGQEYYFIIERLYDDQRCGTIRIYNIMGNEATWGSFILNDMKPPRAALDALIGIHKLIFRNLKKSKALFDVRVDNIHALNLYNRFGGQELNRTGQDIFFQIESKSFYDSLRRLEENL